MKSKSISSLITGFDGFVGPYLAQHLLSKGRSVFGTIYIKRKQESLIPYTISPETMKKTSVFAVDLENFKNVVKLIQTVRPDEVYHLAGISHVPTSWKDPQATFSINVMGTVHLLEAIRELGKDTRILIVSSAEVYGAPGKGELPTRETCTFNPENPYAASKAAIDLLARQWSEFPGFHIVRVRPFSHTGPGQTTDFACPAFACQAAAIALGIAPPIIKTGNLAVKRDFLDVRDVVKAYFLALGKGLNGEVYNVCSGKSRLLSGVLKTLKSFCEREVSVEMDVERIRPSDIPETRGSFAKLARITGWRPEIPFRQTLLDLYRYYYGFLKKQSSISSTRTKL